MTKKVQSFISEYIEKMFNGFRLNLLGPDKHQKGFMFSVRKFDPKTTLAYHYLQGNTLNSVKAIPSDEKTVKKITDVAENYVEALEQKTKADVTRIVGEAFDNINLISKTHNISYKEASQTQEASKYLKDMEEALAEQKSKTLNAADLIVGTEVHNSQSLGILDGIIGASKSMGIKDPTCFKLVIADERLCPVCRKLWLLPDGITPKVYKLSELSAGPGTDRKNPQPSVMITHFRCRCLISLLLPSFGFQNGKISFIGNNHNEWEHQRNHKKP
jgi:hypothetical protein